MEGSSETPAVVSLKGRAKQVQACACNKSHSPWPPDQVGVKSQAEALGGWWGDVSDCPLQLLGPSLQMPKSNILSQYQCWEWPDVTEPIEVVFRGHYYN